jgi:hypothetical protein
VIVMRGWRRWGLALVLLAGVIGSAVAQTPTNGSFESGLSGWTVGGTNQAASITAANMPCCLTTAADGSRFAALSTGPNDVAGGAAINIDGVGGNNDFDAATLSTTLTFTGSPAYLAFAWSFGNSEQAEANIYDDLFDVAIDGSVVFARSVPKNDNSVYSSYPDAPRGGQALATRQITGAAPISGSNIAFGTAPFQVACVAIPATVAGPNSKTLRFRVADQSDAGFDSVAFIDDVRVVADCADVGAPLLRQLTSSAATTVEVKGGGLEFRIAQSRGAAVDDTGRDIAFISSANLTGDNPNVIEQVYMWNGASFARVAGLNVLSGGQVQSVGLSGDTRNGFRGRYVAIAAQLTATDNTEIYRWDRNTSTLTQITTTSGCDNRNPQISDDGIRLVFDSTCNSLTAAGVQRRIVFWDGGVTTSRPAGGAACFARLPRMGRSNSNRFVTFESNCATLSGANADGNSEIYRWQRTPAASFTRVTTTAANVINASPDISADGNIIFFVSNQYDASGASTAEVYRWSSGTTTRITNSANLAYYLGVRIDINATRYAFERLNLATFSSEIGHARTDQTGETVVAVDPGQLIPAFGVDGVNAVISFGSPGDHSGSNADGNAELFQYQGQ